LKWTINPDGSSSSIQVKSTDIDDSTVEGCITKVIQSIAFPAAAKKTAVSHPFLFKKT
jgi:hypothetical protein